jgi:hypothetical protein
MRNQRSVIGTIVPAYHGTIEILGFRGPWRIERYRTDGSWTLEGRRPYVDEKSMCASHDDTTPRHPIYGGYDADCSCCWLNITHTEAKHRRCVGELP